MHVQNFNPVEISPANLNITGLYSAFIRNDVWQLFLTGMKELNRHAGRSNIDPDSIACSNLRLLHRTLLSDASYRKLIKMLIKRLDRMLRPEAINLITNNELCADLICIQRDQIYNLNPPHHTSINLVLIGGFINTAKDSLTHGCQFSDSYTTLWNFIRHISSSKKIHENDIFLIHSNENKTGFIKAGKKGAVILSVASPILSF